MGARTGTYPNELIEVMSLDNDDTILIARGNNIFTASTGVLATGGITVENVLNSTSTVNALSAAQGKALSDALAQKLDISSYNGHYKGTFTNDADLKTEHPTANLGNFALVDAGTGDNAHIYIWDAQEGWVQGGQTSLLNTDALTEGSTNKYFTNARVKSAFVREDATFAASALASNASSTNTFNIATRYQLLHITTSHPCRVRLYASVAQRDADVTRQIGTDPTGNHGLFFEFISSSELLSADLSPLVDGFSNSVAIPYSVTNLSGATQTITVTLNHVKTGAL
jgi:hypothetical protein